jgi:excisionase family DNA binding protein
MESLLTVDEIAEYLNVKPSTIYQWTHQGFIPHIKLGNLVRFDLKKIGRWLDGRSTNGKKDMTSQII